MKKGVAAAVLALVTVAASAAYAEVGRKTVEATLNYGTEAFEDLGGQFGITTGFGYEFKENLQGRIDLSYFRSSTDEKGMNVTGARVPLDFGARYYFPLHKIDADLTSYGQAGLEVSFDNWRPDSMSGRKSETRFGGLLGAGLEYALDANYGATANMQYHIIEDGYLSLGIGMNYHF